MNRSTLAAPAPRGALTTLETGYLRVTLPNQIQAVVPMSAVQEVLALPIHRITAIPNMPVPVLGLMNRRSQILWLVDLANLLGVGSLELNRQTQPIVVLKQGNTLVGFAVTEVEGMIALNPETFHVPTHTPPSLLPYLQGCTVQNTDIVLVLNPEAILQAPVLQI
ncbi:chemotaxis protein CheW [Alkalinema pantanalense CENA528]|uniref:chemotaxis protein CheW n=1 Tax=Alkalinema pantanalense TaxID=1620705 RepID=UPI003D7001E4